LNFACFTRYYNTCMQQQMQAMRDNARAQMEAQAMGGFQNIQ
jgi:hypothetical protein